MLGSGWLGGMHPLGNQQRGDSIFSTLYWLRMIMEKLPDMILQASRRLHVCNSTKLECLDATPCGDEKKGFIEQ